MRSIRIVATAALVLVGVYLGFRAIVARCTGPACDAYIPISLLIPLLIWAMAAISAVMGIVRAKPASVWFVVLVVLSVLGFAGPPAALWLFRDSPDMFVTVAIAMELVVIVGVLSFSFAAGRQRPARGRD